MDNNICSLYHFRLLGNEDLNAGYIGVTSNMSKRKYKHIATPVNSVTKGIIESGVFTEFVVILVANRDYCLTIEKLLRPEPNIGWNVITGGENAIFPEDVKELLSIRKIGNTNVGSGTSHHFYGKTGKESVRYGTRGAKSPNYKGLWYTPFGVFESKALASESTGVPMSTIHNRCNSQNFNDWYFEPITKEGELE